jgi:hypothetical protein
MAFFFFVSELTQAALCFRAHSGWAVLVTVSGPIDAPVVLQRRRVELAGPGIPGSIQPYHAAKEMSLDQADAFLKRCATVAAANASRALREAIAELTDNGISIVGAEVLLGAGRPTPDLARTLASHPMIHTAEGHFFREALLTACESCNLPVNRIKEKDLPAQASARLGLAPKVLEKRVLELGKAIGPPWRQDEKLCTLGAWLVLACLDH